MSAADDLRLGEGTGPLRGLKVVEIAGIGPGPHACMLLADLGADVIRLERPGGGFFNGGAADVLNRGRPSVAVDLKNPRAAELVLELVGGADVLIEGMRPGAMERLGLGPTECLAHNPRLVYGRMTGWGQTGPLAERAGHDLTYVAQAGALHAMGQDRERPHFPSNLVGDFGGGSTYLVIGVLAALVERAASGRGQVVDAAIVDGTAHLNAIAFTLAATGLTSSRRAGGLIDGGAPYYDLYRTADDRHLAVAPLEPAFYDELVARLGLEAEELPDRFDPAGAGELRELLTGVFAERTSAEWQEIFSGGDACVTPVLTLDEAVADPANVARGVFVEHAGMVQPAPAPRFSRTHAALGRPPSAPGADTVAALSAWGIAGIDSLLAARVVVQA